MKLGLKEQVIKEIIKECIQPLLELKKGFEKQENRIDDITDGLPTEKYPSVNAVINFVKNKITAFGESISTVYAKQNDFENLKTDVKGYIHSSEKGAKSGVATLDESGFVPAYQLPTHTFDDELSAESENAVQNKVVKSELDNLKLELYEQKDNITATATGNAITIDSAKAPLQQLKLYGKTTQNGTPTPDAPVPLVSVGDSGSFEVGVYGRNLFDITTLKPRNSTQGGTVSFNGDVANISSKNQNWAICNSEVIKVIPNKTYTFSFSISNYSATTHTYINISNVGNSTCDFSSNGNYIIEFIPTVDFINISVCSNGSGTSVTNTFTISNAQLELGTQATPYEPFTKQTLTMPYTLRGQGNVKDEVDFNKGVLIQRVKEVTFKGIEEWGYMAGYGFFCYIPDMKKQSLLLSNLYPANNTTTIKDKCVSTKFGSGDYIWLFDSDYNENVDSLKTSLASNPMTVIYELATPIETPLTETELNDYRQLYTNKGTTTVLSEADMELDYYINKPNAQAIGNLHEQITKDYFKLTGVLNMSESTEQGGEDVE